jgi:hypothetical protein
MGKKTETDLFMTSIKVSLLKPELKELHLKLKIPPSFSTAGYVDQRAAELEIILTIFECLARELNHHKIKLEDLRSIEFIPG